MRTRLDVRARLDYWDVRVRKTRLLGCKGKTRLLGCKGKKD
jgi:hypothetical protein